MDIGAGLLAAAMQTENERLQKLEMMENQHGNASTPREALLAAIQAYAEEWAAGKATLLSRTRSVLFAAIDAVEGTQAPTAITFGARIQKITADAHRVALANWETLVGSLFPDATSIETCALRIRELQECLARRTDLLRKVATTGHSQLAIEAELERHE
jgi:hypothetical protein